MLRVLSCCWSYSFFSSIDVTLFIACTMMLIHLDLLTFSMHFWRNWNGQLHCWHLMMLQVVQWKRWKSFLIMHNAKKQQANSMLPFSLARAMRKVNSPPHLSMFMSLLAVYFVIKSFSTELVFPKIFTCVLNVLYLGLQIQSYQVCWRCWYGLKTSWMKKLLTLESMIWWTQLLRSLSHKPVYSLAPFHKTAEAVFPFLYTLSSPSSFTF